MADLLELHTTWGGVAGAPYYTTLRGIMGAGLTPQEFGDAWADLLDSLEATFDNALTYEVLAELTIIDSATGTLVGTTNITPTSGGGSAITQALPPATQSLIQWSTPNIVEGRRLRGRTFLPGGVIGNSDSAGGVAAGYKSTTDGLINTFLGTVADFFCIYSPTHHVYATVNGGVLWTEFASLRSRRD